MLATKYGSIPAQAAMGLDGWTYGKEITIPADSIDADLEYFPLPVYLRDADVYTADLCTGGTAISGGYGTGGAPAEAFDNTTGSTYWVSPHTGAGVSGVDWVGYQFAAAKAIRHIRYLNMGNTVYGLTSVKIQYSDNGTAWSDACTTAVVNTINTWNEIPVPASGSHAYWRILANANPAEGYPWWVDEIEMKEMPFASNFDFSQCKVDGSDIRFTDASLNLLKFERKEHGPVTYTADLCSGGTPIVSSSYSSSYNETKLVDDNLGSYWRCNTSGAGSWLGYDFGSGVSKAIRQIKYYTAGTTSYNPTSVHAEYSDDGTNWTAAGAETTVVNTINVWITVPIYATSGSHRYWRVVNGSAITWRSYEMEMLEAATNFAVYNVQVPAVTNLSDTKIYMWWGNPDAYNVSIEAWQDQTGKALTYAGNVKIVRNSATDHYASFDGTGDSFTLADSADWWASTGDYCIEVIAKLGNTNEQFMLGQCGTTYGAGACSVYLGISSWKMPMVAFTDGTSWFQVKDSVEMLDTTNYHTYTAVISNHILKLYLDGVSIGTPYDLSSKSLLNSSDLFAIGSCGAYASKQFTGNIKGVRITKGRARYTENFTPPTSFEIDGTDVVLCTNFDTIYDANYAMVQHLGDVLTDASGNGMNGTNVNTAVVDTDLGKARDFNGTSAYIELPAAVADDFDTGDEFTVLMLTDFNTVDANTRMLFAPYNGGVNMYFYLWTTNTFRFYQSSGSPFGVESATIVANTVYALAGKVEAAVMELLVDGVSAGTHSDYAPSAKTGKNTIGAQYTTSASQYVAGQIYSCRVSNIARSDAWIKAESLALKDALLTYTDLAA